MNVGDVRARLWRGYADTRRRTARRGTARPALAAVEANRRDLPQWNAATASAHERYRRHCPPADGAVAVICVSMRAHMIGAVAENLARQCNPIAELVFVADASGFEGLDVEAPFARLRDSGTRVQVVRPPAGATLGAGLNIGLESTTSRFVAKFDDDDWYGPNYLTDARRAFAYCGAGVVGKHSYFAHVDERDATYLRFPGHEFTYSGTLAGGTLVIDRDLVGDLAFRDRSLGEDRAFIGDCHRRGVSTFAADRFNFLQMRRDDNTWHIGTDAFLQSVLEVAPGVAVDEVER